ncbi:hypothetical protein JIN77_02055 [Verrucomicrobiaceae bacterium R5-34]|nr:hypothetical protein [Verrucomicrobiaceae bacterium R5-34]
MPLFSRLRFLAKCWLLLASLSFSLAAQAQESHVKSWPQSFRPSTQAKIVLVQQGGGGREFIYHTKNFALHSLTALNQRNLALFATTAESVPSVIKRLPLPLLGMPKDGRAKVYIFPDQDSFVAAGGPKEAAGYYSGRKQAIMLRADTFLSPPPPSGSRLPPKADYGLLVHEFTHLCMHRDLAHYPTWFQEGVAEYLAAMHETGGVYQFSKVPSSIKRRIKRHLPNDQDHIVLPGIAETMALSSEQWRKRIEQGEAENHYRSYGTSLLIVHTLFHGGSKRRAATREFLAKIQQRPPVKQADQALIPLDERSALQKRIVDYWRPRGLRLEFSSP